jgi:hypothetical protein
MDALARDFADMHDMEVKNAIEYLARDTTGWASRGFSIHKPNRTLDTRHDRINAPSPSVQPFEWRNRLNPTMVATHPK